MFIYKRCVITSEYRRNFAKRSSPTLKCKARSSRSIQVLALSLSTPTSGCLHNTYLSFTVSTCSSFLFTVLETAPGKDTIQAAQISEWNLRFHCLGWWHVPALNINCDCKCVHRCVVTSAKSLLSLYLLFSKILTEKTCFAARWGGQKLQSQLPWTGRKN